MTSFPVLIAGHSQAKYFGKYLSLTDTDVLSYSGFRIDQMFQKLPGTLEVTGNWLEALGRRPERMMSKVGLMSQK
jgi:hypothetical protein